MPFISKVPFTQKNLSSKTEGSSVLNLMAFHAEMPSPPTILHLLSLCYFQFFHKIINSVQLQYQEFWHEIILATATTSWSFSIKLLHDSMPLYRVKKHLVMVDKLMKYQKQAREKFTNHARDHHGPSFRSIKNQNTIV